MKSTSAADWRNILKSFGVKAGDTAIVHSHLPAFGLIADGPSAISDVLRDVVGPEGTVVMPAFTLSFGRTRKFEREATPSEMGVLSERFRHSPGVLRSLHPFHSVSTVGRHAKALSEAWCGSSFGIGSAYEKMAELDAWHICAGVGAEALTHVHYAEEIARVPYRAYKPFPGEVRAGGKTDERTYSMYARDQRFENNLSDWTAILDELGVCTRASLPYGPVLAYRAQATLAALLGLLAKNPGALLTQQSPIADLLARRIVCRV